MDELETLLIKMDGKLDRARNTLLGLLITVLTSMIFVIVDLVIRLGPP